MEGRENRDFDVIIFGATGYTGRYVIEELANSTVSSDIKWAIAGRNVEKLKESLDIVQNYLSDGIDVQKTTIIEADVKSPDSLKRMCQRAKLIINCVGPYKQFGMPVITACVENGTHCVDISGEMEYLEKVQANYYQAARDNKVYIVSSCGFDSIPADYGIKLLKNDIPDLNSVEYFVSVKAGPEGMALNTGTFNSAVNSVHDHLKAKEYNKMLKEKLFKNELPKSKYPLSWRLPPLFYSPEVKGWCTWFIGPDERVILRSQWFNYDYLNERPVQSHGYVRAPSLFTALFFIFIAGIFAFLSFFSFGRYLLEKYPSFFTAGAFSNKGPTRKQVMGTTTTVTLYGEGWKEKLSDPTDQHATKPDVRKKLTITGPEPAYSLTSMCIVHAGLTILQESDKLPFEGGVLTPGAAFGKTSLIKRLEKRGMNFKFEELN